jgi:hypothetical protein
MTSVCAEIDRKIKEQVDTVIVDYKTATIAHYKRAKSLESVERHIANGTIPAPLLNWKCYTFQFPASLGDAEANIFYEDAERLFNEFKSALYKSYSDTLKRHHEDRNQDLQKFNDDQQIINMINIPNMDNGERSQMRSKLLNSFKFLKDFADQELEKYKPKPVAMAVDPPAAVEKDQVQIEIDALKAELNALKKQVEQSKNKKGSQGADAHGSEQGNVGNYEGKQQKSQSHKHGRGNSSGSHHKSQFSDNTSRSHSKQQQRGREAQDSGNQGRRSSRSRNRSPRAQKKDASQQNKKH